MKTIFYADDDQDDLEIFRDAVDAHYNVVLFNSGEELLEGLMSATEQPDAIFVDYHMPLKNGKEIVKILRSHPKYGDIPICLFTNSLVEHNFSEYLHIGVTHIMQKMTTMEGYRDQVRGIVS